MLDVGLQIKEGERLQETLDTEQLHVLFYRADSAYTEVLDEHIGHIGREECG